MAHILSQALRNLKAQIAPMEALTLLPPKAVSLRNEAITLTREAAGKVQEIIDYILRYQSIALTLLDDAKDMIAEQFPMSDIANMIERVYNETENLKMPIRVDDEAVRIASNQIAGHSNDLEKVQADLRTKNMRLAAEANTARAAGERMMRRATFYFPKREHGYPPQPNPSLLKEALEARDRSTACKAQVAHNKMLIVATKHLENVFLDLTSELSAVRNGLHMLDSEIDTVLTDINADNIQPMRVSLFLEAARHQVTLLHSDVS